MPVRRQHELNTHLPHQVMDKIESDPHCATDPVYKSRSNVLTKSTRRNNTSEKVYSFLKQSIGTGEFRPGYPLFEKDIAARMNVSRTPVREAFRLLSQEGLVYTIPGRGAFVPEVSIKEIVEIYQVLQLLEGVAAQMVASRQVFPIGLEEALRVDAEGEKLINEGRLGEYDVVARRFHVEIIKFTGNDTMKLLLERLWNQTRRFAHLTYRQSERLIECVAEHDAIRTAILQHDAQGAGRAMTRHIQNALANALLHISYSDPIPVIPQAPDAKNAVETNGLALREL